MPSCVAGGNLHVTLAEVFRCSVLQLACAANGEIGGFWRPKLRTRWGRLAEKGAVGDAGVAQVLQRNQDFSKNMTHCQDAQEAADATVPEIASVQDCGAFPPDLPKEFVIAEICF